MSARGIIFCLIFCLFGGCASLQENGKKIWGSSISHLEEARSEGQSEKVALSLDESFTRTVKLLQEEGANVYLKSEDKRYVAAMNFKGHVDTTQAGIFFTKIEDHITLVEVASMSPRLVNEIAFFLFPKFKESAKLNKGEIDAKRN